MYHPPLWHSVVDFSHHTDDWCLVICFHCSYSNSGFHFAVLIPTGNLEMSSILKRWLSHLGLLFIFSSFQISGADFFYSNNPFKLPRHSVLFGFKTITNIKQQQQSHFNQITRHVNCTVNVKTLYRYSKLVQIFCYEQNKH